MADTGMFATTEQVKRKAGVNASAVSATEEYINDYLAQVEASINAMCRYDFTNNYSSLNGETMQILAEVASDLAAIYVILYDMSGYTTRIEAEDMINTLRDASLRGLSILRDQKVEDFMHEN